MISLSNTTDQTVAVGQSITFNTVLLKSKNGAECHRKNSGSVKLCARPATYEVHFAANVTGATAGTAVQLSLAIGGETINESTMVYTPAAANAVGNVSTDIPVSNCCCDYDRITVVNTGTVPVIVSANPVLFVHRIA
mgnify:FL=1